MTPFFSVVIPLYNKEAFIEDTIKSVLNQTFKDFEILVINDGSTDKSLNIVKQFENEKISVHTNKNSGLSFSRNYGIDKAKANFIAFLDADDLWAEDFLETIHNLIQLNKKDYVFATSTKVLKPKKNAFIIPEKLNTSSTKLISNYSELTKYLLNFSAIVIHKKVFNKVGLFEKNINYKDSSSTENISFSKKKKKNSYLPNNNL